MSRTQPRRTAVRYSDLERRLIQLVPRGEANKLNSTELVRRYYADDEYPPFNEREVVINRLRSIARKAEFNGAGWTLHKTERAGPQPMAFWIEGDVNL